MIEFGFGREKPGMIRNASQNTVATTGTNLEKGGESGDLGDKGPKNTLEIRKGLIDQHGQKWLMFGRGDDSGWVRIEDIVGGGNGAHVHLAQQGLITTARRSATKLAELVEQFTDFKQADVASRQGWVGDSFALGDGTLFSPEGTSPEIVNIVQRQEKHCVAGSTEEFWQLFGPLVAKQNLLLFGICTAFLAPLLNLLATSTMSIKNPIFDWCGASSQGKSTCAILLPGAIWGSQDRDTGFSETWKMTTGGLESHRRDHNGCFLGIDEANLAGKTAAQRAEFIDFAVFAIADGGVKVSQTMTDPRESSRLVCVSTSNDKLQTLGSKDRADAIAVRCYVLELSEDREFGVLDFLPDGYTASADVIDAIKAGATKDYGAPIRTFLQKLVDANAANKAVVIKYLQARFDYFLEQVNVDKADQLLYRRVKPFALVYAAGMLARHYGAMPSDSKIGGLFKACKTAWTIHLGQKTQVKVGPIVRLRAYVKKNATDFIYVKTLRERSDEKFSACPGFKRVARDDKRELVLAPAAFRRLGLSKGDINLLKKNRILIFERKRNDAQRIIRLQDGYATKERVFVIDMGCLIAGAAN